MARRQQSFRCARLVRNYLACASAELHTVGLAVILLSAACENDAMGAPAAGVGQSGATGTIAGNTPGASGTSAGVAGAAMIGGRGGTGAGGTSLGSGGNAGASAAGRSATGGTPADAGGADDDAGAGDGDGDSAGSGGAGGGGGETGSSAGSGGTAGTGETAAACSGKPGAHRGKSTQMLMAGGLQRKFVYYAPSSLDANKPVPLVIVAHGFNTDSEQMFALTEYSKVADRESFVVAFPEGPTLGPWNVGAPTCTSTVLGLVPASTSDDQAFLDGIIEFAQDDQCIDSNHTFMTGFSMGAYLTNLSGCLRKDLRAIVPHSGGLDVSMCNAAAKKPVLLLHFETDQLIPYMCGIQARDLWLKQNACQSADPEVKMVTGGRCEYYKGCSAGAQVAMCTLMTPAGGDEIFAGHAWSGGSLALAGIGPWVIPETENAAELAWGFFKEYAW